MSVQVWMSVQVYGCVCINLVEAHCYGIGRTGQIFEQSRSSEETDRNVYISICFFTAT